MKEACVFLFGFFTADPLIYPIGKPPKVSAGVTFSVFVERNKNDDSRCHNGKNRHKIDCPAINQQHINQKKPQKNDENRLSVTYFTTFHNGVIILLR